MFKRGLLFLGLLAAMAWPACLNLTIPTDYLTVDAFRRANQAANWTATKNAHDDCADSLNLGPLLRITGWNGNLFIASVQDLAFKVDSDGNGTHKFAFLNGTADTLFKIGEDTVARFYRHVVIDSLTASLPVFTDGSKRLASNAMTGTGSVVMSTSPTIVSPNVTGILAATGGITLGARFIDHTTSISSSTTLSTAHSTVFVNSASGNITVTLPTAVGNSGLTYTIIKIASSNTVSIATTSSQTIGTVWSSYALYAVDGRIKVVSDGANWRILEAFDRGVNSCTYSGITPAPTCLVGWILTEYETVLSFGGGTGSSNSTGFSITGIPSQLWPTAGPRSCRIRAVDNGNEVGALATLSTAGTLTLSIESISGTQVRFNSSGWTGSGNKGLSTSAFDNFTMTFLRE